MTGKILKVASNDLYGNVDDRIASVYACFEHTKYMNNYVVFTMDSNPNKLCYGSIHLKNKSIVVFSVKENIKQYIDIFLNEYITEKMTEFKTIDISKMEKIELVSYNEMDYDNIQLLDNKAIPKVVVNEEVISKKKKPIFLYFLLLILILLAIGLTLLYFKPELFTVKYKGIDCKNNLFDSNLGIHYEMNKNIKFNNNDKVDNISVTRNYIFLDSDSYYEFKNNENYSEYFTNGEGYKYIDNELKFKVFYEEKSVIDDYEEMLTYLNREGYECVVYEYEK
ncbi:MAG: hypothetical protein IJE89_02390 [Bacilli bacterium]|nr:hypothetical protein [Bacilli bacterium]